MVALLVIASAVSVLIGQSSWSEELRSTFYQLRVWRALVAFGLGACLAMAGVIIQAIFQNPLASPSIVGTNSGAALGGQLFILAWHAGLASPLASVVAPEFVTPIGSFLGAWAALSLLLVLIGKRSDALVAILVGFLLSSVFASLGAFVISRAQESWQLGRALLSFSMGSIAGAGPRQAALVGLATVVGLLGAMTWHRHLDMMLTGDSEAQSLGIRVEHVRRWGIIWTSVLCAAAVAVGGNIAFVGLITPHILRPLVGETTRHLLPASALAGGVFVIICDTAARHVASHGETPLGVITGLIGAPVFLVLLLRMQRREERHG